MVIDRYAERIKSADTKKQHPNKVTRIAGLLYGLSFGASFALSIWGIEALILHSSMADLAFAKLAIGLPLTMVIGLIAGGIANITSSVILSIVIWAITCGAWGYLVGVMPYQGINYLTQLIDPRFTGLALIPFNYSAQIRTLIMVIITGFIGIGVGAAQSGTVQKVWDFATPEGKLRPRAWMPMLICIPLALLPAITAYELITKPFIIPHQEVNRLIVTTISGGIEKVKAEGLAYRTVELFGENFTTDYRIHFVNFYTSNDETLYTAYVDVNFDNGFVMRCATAGNYVTYCDNFSSKFAGWTSDIIYYAHTGEKTWLAEEHKKLDVNQATLAWLIDHSQAMTENYKVTRSAQKRGWILMTAVFDNGFSMQCRFHGLAPISVDQCTEVTTTSPSDS